MSPAPARPGVKDTARPDHGRQFRRWSFLLILLLATTSLLPALGGGFVWDDHSLVENNPLLEQPWKAFLKNFDLNRPTYYYRPVVILSLSLDRFLWGTRPFGYHLTNLLLYVLTSLMLLALLSRYLSRGASLAAAALFAVHPVHVEPVASIACRTDLLAGFFLLGALLTLLPRPGEVPGWRRILGGSFLFLLAGLSKESALILPVVVLAAWWRHDGLKAALKRGLPLLFLLATVVVVRSAVLRHVAGLGSWEISHFQWQEYPPFFLSLVRLLFFPLELLPYYVVRPLPPAGVLAVAVLLLLLLGALAWLGKSRRWDTPSILGATILLASIVVILPVFRKQGAIIADRFLYLPSLGLSVLVGCFGELVARKPLVSAPRLNRSLLFGLAAVPVALMLPWSMLRSTDWHDDETLFSRGLSRDPTNPVFHFHLGDLYNGRRQYDKAEPYFRRAVELNPAFHMTRLVLADFYYARGKDAQAAALYAGILAEDPQVYMARYGLAMIAVQRGDYKAAAEDFEAVTRQVPSFKPAWRRLGDCWQLLGRPDLAAHYRKLSR